MFFFFFSSRRRHTRWPRDWSSDVCSSDLHDEPEGRHITLTGGFPPERLPDLLCHVRLTDRAAAVHPALGPGCRRDRDAFIHESTLRTVEYQHGMQMSTPRPAQPSARLWVTHRRSSPLNQEFSSPHAQLLVPGLQTCQNAYTRSRDSCRAPRR